MKILREFREFAMRGNVVDLAIGVIVGASFGVVVKSLVEDIIMPMLGVLLGGTDFTNRYFVLRGGGDLVGNETLAQARESGAAVVAYGQFLNAVLVFFIIAWAVFMLVKTMNRIKRHDKPAPPGLKKCGSCQMDVSAGATRCPHCTSYL